MARKYSGHFSFVECKKRQVLKINFSKERLDLALMVFVI